MKGVEEDARIAAGRDISDRLLSVITPSAVLHDRCFHHEPEIAPVLVTAVDHIHLMFPPFHVARFGVIRRLSFLSVAHGLFD